MSGYVENNVRTFLNDAALSADLRVKRTDSDTLALAGAMDRALGTLEAAAFAVTGGVHCAVRLRNAVGSRRGVAASALSAGDVVYAAASGQLDDVGFVKEGIALTDASGAGAVFEWMPDSSDDEHESAVSIAAAGSVTGDATAVTHRLTTVSAADATKGVKLPTPTKAGIRVFVYNEHALNGLKIYPHTGGDINDGATDAAITTEGKTWAEFLALDTTTWAAVYTAN